MSELDHILVRLLVWQVSPLSCCWLGRSSTNVVADSSTERRELAMNSKHSSAVIAADCTSLEQRLCRFIADESTGFARKYGVTINSIKTDVLPQRFGLIANMCSFVASVQGRIRSDEVSRRASMSRTTTSFSTKFALPRHGARIPPRNDPTP